MLRGMWESVGKREVPVVHGEEVRGRSDVE